MGKRTHRHARLVLGITEYNLAGQPEATAWVRCGKDQFQWDHFPIALDENGLANAIDFIKHMKELAKAMHMKLKFTKEFRQEMRELRKDELQNRNAACQPGTKST